MAKQANPTVVGGFVVAAVVLAVAGIITFGSGDWLREEYKFVAYFDDSVSGLDVGAPIRYKGVQVGSVSGIKATWHGKDDVRPRIPVELTFIEGSVEQSDSMQEAYPDTYAFIQSLVMERGLKAELKQDSFVTGKLYVALDFKPDEPLRQMGHTELPEIPTTLAGLSKLQKSLEELPIDKLINQAIETLAAIEARVEDPKLGEFLAKLDQLVADLDAEVKPLSESALATMEGARSLMQNADAQVKPLSSSTEDTMAEARTVLANLNKTLGEDSALLHQLAVLMEEFTEAAQAVRLLADYIERHPEAIITGKGD